MRYSVRRRSVLAALTTLSIALAGCSASRPPTERTIRMTDSLTYEPAETTIALGGTVIWETVGEIEHTVTAYGDRIPDRARYFSSGGFETERAARRNITTGLVAAGEVYTHTFNTPGRYEYVCLPHEANGMTGTLIVR